MKEVVLDTILDSIKLIPFLLLAFFIIEIVEHKLNNKVIKTISKSKKCGPLFGSLFGLFPQCGFSVIATNLYVTRIISLGTLISIYLSTSDEMLPILISNKVDIKVILSILLVKFGIGLLFGFIIDLVYRKKESGDYHICENDECGCKHNIVLSSVKHTFKTILYIFIITLLLNTLIYFVDTDKLSSLFLKESIFSPFLSSLVGLIPNCSSSIIITELYINDVITFGTLLSGLLTNSGLAIIILFKSNKNVKENALILLTVYLIGVVVGIIFNLI